MPKISLAFHAVADELVAWAGEWCREHQLHMVLERFSREPRGVAVDDANIDAAIRDLGGWNRMWLSPQPLTVAPGKRPPIAGHPHRLSVYAGELTEGGLRESGLGATTATGPTLQTWRAIVKSAKSKMRKGAWVINPVFGGKSRLKDHYFSEGALALSRSGTKMLAVAGWNEYVFDPK